MTSEYVSLGIFLSIASAYNNVSIVNLIYGSSRELSASTIIELWVIHIGFFNINIKFLESKRFLMLEVNCCQSQRDLTSTGAKFAERDIISSQYFVSEIDFQTFFNEVSIFVFRLKSPMIITFEPHTEKLEILSLTIFVFISRCLGKPTSYLDLSARPQWMFSSLKRQRKININTKCPMDWVNKYVRL